MVVLLTGATGFIGSRLVEALIAAGHHVVCAVRDPTRGAPRARARYVPADFTTDFESAAWLPRLAGVDAVINAAGILRERGKQNFYSIHVRGPEALFNACVLAGVRHVVQISALGADENARSRYHTSKREADEFLSQLPLEWVVVQPSLVYGPGGGSAALFDALASAPWVPLPGRGDQRVQPVHIEDVIAGIVVLLADPDVRRTVVPFVGPEPLTLREFLGRLRRAMGLRPARFLPVPLPLVRLAARAGTAARRGLLETETLAMLLRGNVGDSAPLERLLQRPARSVDELVEPSYASAVAVTAKLRWLVPPLRWSIALMWIISGVVSLGLYPIDASLRLLARVGITTEPAAPLMLYGAALLDIGLGIATIVLARRRLLWLAQIALILGYTLIITLRLPELWLEPFGPVFKNIPILAALWLLYELDDRRWNT